MVLASEPVGGRSRATELSCYNREYSFYVIIHQLPIIYSGKAGTRHGHLVTSEGIEFAIALYHWLFCPFPQQQAAKVVEAIIM